MIYLTTAQFAWLIGLIGFGAGIIITVLFNWFVNIDVVDSDSH